MHGVFVFSIKRIFKIPTPTSAKACLYSCLSSSFNFSLCTLYASPSLNNCGVGGFVLRIFSLVDKFPTF